MSESREKLIDWAIFVFMLAGCILIVVTGVKSQSRATPQELAIAHQDRPCYYIANGAKPSQVSTLHQMTRDCAKWQTYATAERHAAARLYYAELWREVEGKKP